MPDLWNFCVVIPAALPSVGKPRLAAFWVPVDSMVREAPPLSGLTWKSPLHLDLCFTLLLPVFKGRMYPFEIAEMDSEGWKFSSLVLGDHVGSAPFTVRDGVNTRGPLSCSWAPTSHDPSVVFCIQRSRRALDLQMVAIHLAARLSNPEVDFAIWSELVFNLAFCPKKVWIRMSMCSLSSNDKLQFDMNCKVTDSPFL